MPNPRVQLAPPWLAAGPTLVVIGLLAGGVLLSGAVAAAAYRYSSLPQRTAAPAVNVFGPEAAARGWPALAPHTQPWPAVRQWSEWRAPGARRRMAWSTRHQMEWESYGWPAGIVTRCQFWWPWNDPVWASKAPSDPGFTVSPIGLLIDALVFAGLLWLLVFAPGVLRWYRRRRRGLCPECAYNLTGNVSGACPECGRLTERGDAP